MNLKTLNRKGRPKGSLNKNTAEIKGKLTQIIGEIIDHIDIQSLNDADKIKYLNTIMPYSIGKMGTDLNIKMEEFANIPFSINTPPVVIDGKETYFLNGNPILSFEN